MRAGFSHPTAVKTQFVSGEIRICRRNAGFETPQDPQGGGEQNLEAAALNPLRQSRILAATLGTQWTSPSSREVPTLSGKVGLFFPESCGFLLLGRREGCLLAKFPFLEIDLGEDLDLQVQKLMCSNDVAAAQNLLARLDTVA